MTVPDQSASPRRTAEVLLELADTLADDFDVPVFLQRLSAHCVELLVTDGAGVMLAADDGTLRLLASTGDGVRDLELSELDSDDGPCVSAFRTGTAVTRTYLAHADSFGSRARAAGFRCAHAIPMRRGEQVIGALNLFRHTGEPLSPDRQRLGRSLADMATVGLLQQRAVTGHRTLSGQLQRQFTTRLAIEQAKGLLAERHAIAPEEAFNRLRRHARDTNQKLADLAKDLLDGTVTLPAPSRDPRTG